MAQHRHELTEFTPRRYADTAGRQALRRGRLRQAVVRALVLLLALLALSALVVGCGPVEGVLEEEVGETELAVQTLVAPQPIYATIWEPASGTSALKPGLSESAFSTEH